MEQQNNSETLFIFKRSFIGFFWGIVFIPLFIAYFLFKAATPETLISYNIGVENPYVMGAIIFYGILGVIYAFITRHIKQIERVIRLMSEKDGSKMMPKKSLTLARKIFKETVKFKFTVFIKYYKVIASVFFVTFCISIGSLILFALDNQVSIKPTHPFIILDSTDVGIIFAITALVVLLGWMYIHFYLAAKTRFVWFTYMSYFGEIKTKEEIFKEVEKLNNFDSNDDKIAMLGYFKRDMAADMGTVATSTLTQAIPKGLGRDIAGGYARGMALDMSEYSKIKLNYEQYKDVYFKVYGKNPELGIKLLEL